MRNSKIKVHFCLYTGSDNTMKIKSPYFKTQDALTKWFMSSINGLLEIPNTSIVRKDVGVYKISFPEKTTGTLEALDCSVDTKQNEVKKDWNYTVKAKDRFVNTAIHSGWTVKTDEHCNIFIEKDGKIMGPIEALEPYCAIAS